MQRGFLQCTFFRLSCYITKPKTDNRQQTNQNINYKTTKPQKCNFKKTNKQTDELTNQHITKTQKQSDPKLKTQHPKKQYL